MRLNTIKDTKSKLIQEVIINNEVVGIYTVNKAHSLRTMEVDITMGDDELLNLFSYVKGLDNVTKN